MALKSVQIVGVTADDDLEGNSVACFYLITGSGITVATYPIDGNTFAGGGNGEAWGPTQFNITNPNVTQSDFTDNGYVNLQMWGYNNAPFGGVDEWHLYACIACYFDSGPGIKVCAGTQQNPIAVGGNANRQYDFRGFEAFRDEHAPLRPLKPRK